MFSVESDAIVDLSLVVSLFSSCCSSVESGSCDSVDSKKRSMNEGDGGSIVVKATCRKNCSCEREVLGTIRTLVGCLARWLPK
jgi:hypothetical protein